MSAPGLFDEAAEQAADEAFREARERRTQPGTARSLFAAGTRSYNHSADEEYWAQHAYQLYPGLVVEVTLANPYSAVKPGNVETVLTRVHSTHDFGEPDAFSLGIGGYQRFSTFATPIRCFPYRYDWGVVGDRVVLHSGMTYEANINGTLADVNNIDIHAGKHPKLRVVESQPNKPAKTHKAFVSNVWTSPEWLASMAQERLAQQVAGQYPQVWQSPEPAPAGGEQLPAPVATETEDDLAFAQAQRLRILKLKKRRQESEVSDKSASPEAKPGVPGKTEGWSTGGRLGSHYFLATGNNTGVALCNKSLKPPFLYGLNENAPADACQRCLKALKKRGVARHEVIQPEHLQIGRVLRARDLEKLRKNFWFKDVPADYAGVFVVGSVPIPTRITPTTGSRFKWYIVAGQGRAHLCSLNVIRQFFELATDYTGPQLEVWMARIADDWNSSGSDTRHVALPAGLSPMQAEEAAKVELGVPQVMKVTRVIGQVKPNATS